MLARAERLHGVFFSPARQASRLPVWQPPADVLETESEILVLMALPGVDPDQVEVAIDNADLVVEGLSMQHPALQTATIHRLELPHGRFQRRIPIPPGRYASVRRESVNGCLVITLQKAGTDRG